MIGSRTPVAIAALGAAVAAGCGLGPGRDQGDVTLTITRGYGRQVLESNTDSIQESDSAFRVLDRSAEITTRYGGGFVQSIDGISGGQSRGRRSDWFFYVNGIESSIGAAQFDLSRGDRVWWDYRDWTSAMRVPAVVGSWPEPFAHGFRGDRWPALVDCRRGGPACGLVAGRLRSGGARVQPGGPTGSIAAAAIKVVVGPWEAVRTSAARSLARGPSESGVFARFVGDRRPLLELENERGEPAGSVGRGGGLIAALRDGDGPPTWVVTGTDEKGVAAAARLLGPALRNRYAVAMQPGAGPIGVPVP